MKSLVLAGCATSRVRDIEVGLPTLCGARWFLAAGWQPARHKHRKADTNRPQDAILPYNLAYTYAQLSNVLPLNRAGPHFHVAHPY